MSIRLHYRMAMEYGFTPWGPQGVYYDRSVVWFLRPDLLKRVLGPWREQCQKLGL